MFNFMVIENSINYIDINKVICKFLKIKNVEK